jgi:ribosome-binding protein aMBF1 (putative translation factor)
MKKTKPNLTCDGIAILEHRYLKNNPVRQKRVAKYMKQLEIGQQIYDLRQAAGLTQAQLAKIVGTTHSVISRLEDADYNGHSLKMLQRIATCLGKNLTVRIEDRPSATSKKRATG